MNPASEDELHDLRSRVAALTEAAERQCGETRWYRMVGEDLAVHVDRGGRAAQILRALEPLRLPAPGPGLTRASAFEVFVWDGGASAPVLSPLRTGEHDGQRDHAVVVAPGVQAYADRASGVLSVYDGPRQRAHWWLNDATRVPYYEVAAPLRHILQARALARGGVMLHAAAVGRSDGGLLLVGGGGSGKSTTALACLDAGLGYASDDYVLVDGAAPPVVHMAYSTAKVVRASLGRHPEYAAHFRNLDREHEKPMMFVHDFAPAQILRSFPLRALVMPVIARRHRTHIVAATGPELLRAMVPSSLLLSPFAGAAAMQRMAALCRAIPCYRAELAESADDVGDAFSAFAATLSRSRPEAAA